MASFASSATTCGARKHAWTKKRLNDGDNKGQATHGARKHAWRTQAAWANVSKMIYPVQDDYFYPKNTSFLIVETIHLFSDFRSN